MGNQSTQQLAVMGKTELEKPLTSNEKQQTLHEISHLAELYYTAECECKAPNFVFWLSESKRNKCIEAKTNFANALVSSGLDCVEELQKQARNQD